MSITRAVSLRKLTTYCPTYNGFCLRVKRSSDSTTQDIGFSSGFLDTASLLSFVGAGDGTVAIWYDQSGNGRNWIGDAIHGFPVIVSSGVLQTINNKAAIRSINPQTFTSTSGTQVQPCTTLAVWSVDDISKTNFGLALINGPSGSEGNAYWYGLDNSLETADGQQGVAKYGVVDIGSGTDLMVNGAAAATGFQHTGTQWSFYFNGALDGTGADTNTFTNNGSAQIFSLSGATPWNAGTCQELIEWNVALGDSTSEGSSLEQYQYWIQNVSLLLMKKTMVSM